MSLPHFTLRRRHVEQPLERPATLTMIHWKLFTIDRIGVTILDVKVASTKKDLQVVRHLAHLYRVGNSWVHVADQDQDPGSPGKGRDTRPLCCFE